MAYQPRRATPKRIPVNDGSVDNLRQTYKLTPEEQQAFGKLTSWPPDSAFKFWQIVAANRGLDYQTIIGNPQMPHSFSAMMMGHGKHWCWPTPLKCLMPAPEFAPKF